MYLRPASWAMRTASAIGRLRTRGELDQHRQVDAGQHLDARMLHDRDREVGRRAAEHVGQHDHAVAGVAGPRPLQDLAAPLFHVVLGADADRRDALLRTDDMLQRGQEFARQIAVGHEYDADHPPLPESLSATCPPRTSVSRCERVTERPALAQPVCQPFGDRDRAVPAAGAAHGDGQIALALGVESRQQRPDQPFQPVDERLVVGVGGDEGGHRPVDGR